MKIKTNGKPSAKPPAKAGEGGGVTALERGLRLLTAFDQGNSVLTLSGLAHRTGLNKSTILRLMVSLEREGFVDKDEEGLYRIGSQAWRVGTLFNGELRLQQLLPPILHELSVSVDESVSFWVPTRSAPPQRLCICRAEPPRSLRVHTLVGNTLPLDTGGSTARTMRAFVEPQHREDDKIRAERGCATWAERDPELCGVSSPVFGIDGAFVGVLSVSAPISRRDKKWLQEMRPVVIKAADSVTASLGVNSYRRIGQFV